ncbi:trehalase family glycosidase [Paraburkholderia sprentiae]|nr:trehalase family glycosidase [Paraburkholderia sprentiae]
MRFVGDASDKSAGGGEYPLQDGFGWTNGVVRSGYRMRRH